MNKCFFDAVQMTKKKKKKQFHMVTGGGHKCSCRSAVKPLAPSLSMLPSVYRQRHTRKIGVSSSMAKYGTALSAPHISRPIKTLYQHQQDTAGHRETIAWL